MKLRAALKFMSVLFFAITTFEILFIAALGFIIDSSLTFMARELYRIPLIALLSVMPVLIMVRDEKASRAEWIVRKVLHLLLTAGIVFFMLIHYKWMDRDNALFIISFFSVVYVAGCVFEEFRAKRLADRLNARIKAIRGADIKPDNLDG